MRLTRELSELIFPATERFYTTKEILCQKKPSTKFRRTRACVTKANEAAQRENLDYAIALFNQVLEKEPGFFECRKALRAAQFRKAGDKGSGFFKRMLSGAGSSRRSPRPKWP